MSLIAVLASTITFGLLHGVNPSHGWPIATLYSMRSKRPFVSGFISSSILAGAHFVSSIIVVLAYILVSTLIEIPQIYLHYGAAIGLGILTIIFWKEKSEDYVKTQHGHLHNSQSPARRKKSALEPRQESHLANLTGGQRQALITAYSLDYYDVPRKMSSEKVSRHLNMDKSTFSGHLRKAEREIVAQVIAK